MNEDVVNKPKHYISETGLETIDVITAFTKGLDGAEAFCAGNALKYLCRWNHKNGTEDLRKAICSHLLPRLSMDSRWTFFCSS
jgi:hypothetical protein